MREIKQEKIYFSVYQDIRKLPSQTSNFTILWVKGNATLLIDGEKKTLSNDIICLNPGYWVTTLNIIGEALILEFNSHFYCIEVLEKDISCNGLLFNNTLIPAIVRVNKEDLVVAFWGTISELIKELDVISAYAIEMTRVLLKRLLIKLTRVYIDQNKLQDIYFEETKENQTIRKFHTLINKHFLIKKSLKEYADILGISEKTLSNIFSKYSKETPSKLLKNRIILEAKRLLIYSEQPIKEIAYQLGYDDYSNFTKLFKNETGITPLEFKTQRNLLP